MKKKNIEQSEFLLNVIIEAIKNKKGKEIVSIDLRKIENSVCEYFVICTGDSTTQLGAIVEEIKEKAKEIAKNPVDHIEGLKNSQWVLMDFINIVVHAFLPDQRNFYHLEDLWADGKIVKYESD